MPSRYVREGIISSERVDMLSEPAEVCYRRMFSIVDDYGRYYANPTLILAACYPLRIGKKTIEQVQSHILEIVKAGLAVVYGNGKYIQLADFRQQVRGKSKFPEPDSEKPCEQVVPAIDNQLLIKGQSDDNQSQSECRALTRSRTSTVTSTRSGSGLVEPAHYRRLMDACPDEWKPTIEQLVAWDSIRVVEKCVDHIEATLKAEPPHRWSKFGTKLVLFAINEAADRHERLSVPKRPVSAPNARGGVFGPGGHPTPTEWENARNSAADAVWRAKESGDGPEAVKRAMQHARKTWGDVPKFQGKDAVDVGISLARNNPRPVVEIPGSA